MRCIERPLASRWLRPHAMYWMLQRRNWPISPISAAIVRRPSPRAWATTAQLETEIFYLRLSRQVLNLLLLSISRSFILKKNVPSEPLPPQTGKCLPNHYRQTATNGQLSSNPLPPERRELKVYCTILRLLCTRDS